MSSLVVFGSTGRHISFTKQDLVMPPLDHFKTTYGEAAAHYAEKQWPSLATFWMTRVLKDSKLHSLTAADVVVKMEADVMHRFRARKEEQHLHKKRKRLLENTDPEKGAGVPSPSVLITNFIDLKTYQSDAAYGDTTIEMLIAECKDLASAKRYVKHELLIDAEGQLPQQPEVTAASVPSDDSEPLMSRGAKTEAASDAAVVFDDRVALLVTFDSDVSAATVVAKLHGRLLEGRRVLCRFFV